MAPGGEAERDKGSSAGRGPCEPKPAYSPFSLALGGSSPFSRRYMAACE